MPRACASTAHCIPRTLTARRARKGRHAEPEGANGPEALPGRLRRRPSFDKGSSRLLYQRRPTPLHISYGSDTLKLKVRSSVCPWYEELPKAPVCRPFKGHGSSARGLWSPGALPEARKDPRRTHRVSPPASGAERVIVKTVAIAEHQASGRARAAGRGAAGCVRSGQGWLCATRGRSTGIFRPASAVTRLGKASQGLLLPLFKTP